MGVCLSLWERAGVRVRLPCEGPVIALARSLPEIGFSWIVFAGR